jgi:hypothetical protein
MTALTDHLAIQGLVCRVGMQDFKLLGNDDARLVQFIQHAADGFQAGFGGQW